MKNLAVFLDPFKPTHSMVLSGELRAVAPGVIANFVPFGDLDVILSSLEDPYIIWLL